jgi:hypothetical protein
MAGSEEQHPSLSTAELVSLIGQVKRNPLKGILFIMKSKL